MGLSANASRINTDQGEGGGAYGYALAMTPLGRPMNFTNPDSAGLLDPRPDDDPLNINPVLEAQSVTRQQNVNRVFGSAYAEYQIANGLSYPHELRSGLHAAHERLLQRPVDARHLREPRREQHEPGPASAGRPVQPAGFHVHARQPGAPEPHHRLVASVRHHGPVHRSSTTGSRRTRCTRRTCRTHAALVRPRLGHRGQRSEPHLRVVARVVHGTRQLHVRRPVLDLGNGPLRRFEPSRAGEQVGDLPVGRSRRGSSAKSRSCAASTSSIR